MKPLLMVAFASLAVISQAQTVRCITDISHEFSFYFDGRFASNYLGPIGGSDVRNWATVSKINLDGANLFVTAQGRTPCPWTDADIAKLKSFVRGGGGLLMIGSYQVFPGEKDYKLNALAGAFGTSVTPTMAVEPLSLDASIKGSKLTNYPTQVLSVESPRAWTALVKDKVGAPVMVSRRIGKGKVILASGSLFGHNPDASDPINNDWIPRVLQWLASGKDVTHEVPPQSTQPENAFNDRGLKVQYNDYTAPAARAIAAYFFKCLPEVRAFTGVEPSQGMLLNLQMLATDGGGFSSGATIGLGAYWGDFPTHQYGMVELIGHEMTHSWVKPFDEPMWNEGLATYVGIHIAKRLGFTQEADETLAKFLNYSRANDPTGKLNLNGDSMDWWVRMGKPMAIFEELRKKFGDGIIAKYFSTKRKLIQAGRRGYSASDAVAIFSRSVGMDVFPRFKEFGTNVDWSQTDISRSGLKAWDGKP